MMYPDSGFLTRPVSVGPHLVRLDKLQILRDEAKAARERFTLPPKRTNAFRITKCDRAGAGGRLEGRNSGSAWHVVNFLGSVRAETFSFGGQATSQQRRDRKRTDAGGSLSVRWIM